MQTYPEIVAVGHLCMDKLHICERMPQENTSAHILSYTQQPGGTACQAAVAACRLGATAGYLSPLGDDEVGRSLYEGCVEEGLDMSLCRVDPGVVTHFTNVIVNAQRNTRTFLSYHGKFAPINFGEAERDYICILTIQEMTMPWRLPGSQKNITFLYRSTALPPTRIYAGIGNWLNWQTL